LEENILFTKKIIVSLLLVIAVCLSISELYAKLRQIPGEPIVFPGEIILIFHDATSNEDVDNLIEKYKEFGFHENTPFAKRRRLDFDRKRSGFDLYQLFRFNPELVDPDWLLEQILKEDIVKDAGFPTAGFSAQIIPPDPHYHLQWNLPNVQAPQAWHFINEYTPRNSREVIVAVLDRFIFQNYIIKKMTSFTMK
jgi:hypothetical protein